MSYSRFQRYALNDGGGSASRRSASASHSYRHRNARAHQDPRHNQERGDKLMDNDRAAN